MQACARGVLIALLFCAGMAGPAAAQKAINDFVNYRNQQKWPEALEVIRKEIDSPAAAGSAYLSDIRVLGLSALANYVSQHELEPDMDAEATRYYEDGLKYAQNDVQRKAQVHHGLVLFYSLSSRNGLAIPYMKKELAAWQALNDTYQVLIAYDALASAYYDMGETALGLYYREKALEIAAEFFVVGERPDDQNQWLNYDNLLQKHADNIAAPGRAEDLKRIFALREAIAKKYLAFASLTYMQKAKLFAVAEESDLAQAALRTSKALWAEEQKQLAGKPQLKHFDERMQIDFICAHAQILYEAGMRSEARHSAQRCEQAWQASGMSLGASTLGLIGAIYEAGGDSTSAVRVYRASIEGFERTRSSFPVAERAAFFRQGVSRRPYWGLIRTLAGRASTSGNNADFLTALHATERIRARQFGELADPDAPDLVTLDDLQRLQRGLDPDAVVLNYIVTDESIVLNAFTHDRWRTKVIPFARDGFRARIRLIVTRLADPHSGTSDFEPLLLELSRVIITPVADLIGDRSQVLVLTDGELNLVPFGLWSLDPQSYRPLIQLKTVSALPSLRFLVRPHDGAQRAVDGLFALADPVYPDPSMVGEVPATVIRAVTRSDGFRSYFAPLPETRSEVEAISSLLPTQMKTLLLGSEALESKVKQTPLSRYRFVHFATHGILGGDVPGIVEPALVLGREASQDGFLKASEAEGLELNAGLTVLSACNTGSGEFVHGEGVMGLSRAFLIAGSDAVLVSLWSVASKATEDLMVRFYRHIQDGVPPAAALRHAKLEMMETLPHPFFWAPFIIVGRT